MNLIQKKEEITKILPYESSPRTDQLSIQNIDGEQTMSSPSVILPDITSEYSKKYRTDFFIGQGSYSDVFVVVELITKRKYCKKKIFQKKGAKIDVLFQEMTILSKCNHFGIVKLKESFPTENIIILEYIKGKTLKHYISEHTTNNTYFNEQELLFIFYQLCLIMNYLDDIKIIHRDIKPDNIIITPQGFVKLIDFGFSTNEEQSHLLCGTPYYISPEMYIAHTCKEKQYSKLTDIWSLGVVLFEMMTLKKPFVGTTLSQIQENVIYNPPEIRQNFNKYSMELCEIINDMLCKRFSERISAYDILQRNIMKKTGQIFISKIQNSNIDNNIKEDILSYIDKIGRT